MPEYVSKERVERGGYLVYAEGDPIPASDTEELHRQGYLPAKAQAAGEDKAAKSAANKSAKSPQTRPAP